MEKIDKIADKEMVNRKVMESSAELTQKLLKVFHEHLENLDPALESAIGLCNVSATSLAHVISKLYFVQKSPQLTAIGVGVLMAMEKYIAAYKQIADREFPDLEVRMTDLTMYKKEDGVMTVTDTI